MTRRLAHILWLIIGAGTLVLPALPLPAWTAAPDQGPIWTPHVEAWGIGLTVVVVLGLMAGRISAASALRLPRAAKLPVALVVTGLALGLTAAAVYVMRVAFASNPVVVDEVAQLFHAKVFLSGRLAAPPPVPPEAFLVVHTGITQAGWVSQFPPGQTVLLALGLATQAEWLVNPLLGGVDTVLVYLLGRALYNRKTGMVAAFLWAGSGWVMAMSGTYQSHVGAVTFLLVAWNLLWLPRHPRTGHLVLAGLALSAAAATRPLDAVAGTLPILLWALHGRRLASLGWAALGGAPIIAAWAYLNWRIYGCPFTLGYTALWGEAHDLGFHTDPWGRAFTPLIALGNLGAGIRRLNIYLEEWPIPALLPLTLWALGAGHGRGSDLLVAVGAAAAPMLYFFYWYSGEYPGPRFYYVAAPMLLVATARAWWWAWGLARHAAPRANWVRWEVALAAAAVVVVCWGWVGLLPSRLRIYRESFRTLKLHPERTLRDLGVRQALVLVPDSWVSRLIAGLWGLGIRADLAEAAVSRVDACDLQEFLDSARATPAPAAEYSRQLRELISVTPVPAPKVAGWPDESLRLQRGYIPPPVCQIELNRDQQGFTLFGNLVWRNAVGLRSGIVFARDLYQRNPLLLAEYPGWEVWRYAPPPGQPDAPPVLTRAGVSRASVPR